MHVNLIDIYNQNVGRTLCSSVLISFGFNYWVETFFQQVLKVVMRFLAFLWRRKIIQYWLSKKCLATTSASTSEFLRANHSSISVCSHVQPNIPDMMDGWGIVGVIGLVILEPIIIFFSILFVKRRNVYVIVLIFFSSKHIKFLLVCVSFSVSSQSSTLSSSSLIDIL